MNHFRSRNGHTLIEILLALGLSLVVLAAVYAALDQHWRYADAGQRQTERLQLTRALFERMSLDLRSVVFRPGDLANDLPDDGRTVGIVGDGRTLELRIDAPSSASSVGPRSVQWGMDAWESSRRERRPGLARVTWNAANVAEATESKNDLSVSEVETIRFRYFARGNWFNDWNSLDQQELPQAVEITIGFRKPLRGAGGSNDETTSGEYRLLVPVPASEA